MSNRTRKFDLDVPATSQERTRALVWLVATQSLYVLSLLPWLAIAGLSVMAFDAPGSTEMWQPWLFVGAIWSYPLWPLTCAIGAWVLYWRGRMRGAIIATLIPIGLVALVALGLAVVVFTTG